MNKLLVISFLFFLVACNMKGYNTATNKFSKEEESKNFLKKLHNRMISADEFFNTDTKTHTTSNLKKISALARNSYETRILITTWESQSVTKS